jgi:ribosomal protein L29
MAKKEWKSPEIRKLSKEEAARYWEELYKDYVALKLEHMERQAL